MHPVWTLPLRVLFFPLAFAFGYAAMFGMTHMAEYAGCDEILPNGDVRQRLFPFREWLLTALRAWLPELA